MDLLLLPVDSPHSLITGRRKDGGSTGERQTAREETTTETPESTQRITETTTRLVGTRCWIGERETGRPTTGVKPPPTL